VFSLTGGIWLTIPSRRTSEMSLVKVARINPGWSLLSANDL